jgi:hypothetical protein
VAGLPRADHNGFVGLTAKRKPQISRGAPKIRCSFEIKVAALLAAFSFQAACEMPVSGKTRLSMLICRFRIANAPALE